MLLSREHSSAYNDKGNRLSIDDCRCSTTMINDDDFVENATDVGNGLNEDEFVENARGLNNDEDGAKDTSSPSHPPRDKWIWLHAAFHCLVTMVVSRFYYLFADCI